MGATAGDVTERFERLRSEHFGQAMDFLNRAFAEHAPHDFAAMLPSIYQADDEHMRHNLGLFREGRLLAMAGVFPIALTVSGTALRVAGVGGVSVSPEARGQGLFERLMTEVRRLIVADGYELSYLMGMRQRYRRFGWEAGGCELTLAVNRHNLRHDLGDAPLGVTLAPLPPAAGSEIIRELERLHDAQPIHCRRDPAKFERHLRCWFHQPVLARDGAGKLVGYFSGEAKQAKVTELAFETDAVGLEILRAIAVHHDEIELTLPALPSPFADRLGSLARSVALRASGNWQIWDFAAVAGALLRARHRARPLAPGRVVLRAAGAAQAFALWVKGDDAGGETVSSPAEPGPELELDRDTLLRLLFGPLPPAMVARLPPAAELLGAWCPLPLGFSSQDRV